MSIINGQFEASADHAPSCPLSNGAVRISIEDDTHSSIRSDSITISEINQIKCESNSQRNLDSGLYESVKSDRPPISNSSIEQLESPV